MIKEMIDGLIYSLRWREPSGWLWRDELNVQPPEALDGRNPTTT